MFLWGNMPSHTDLGPSRSVIRGIAWPHEDLGHLDYTVVRGIEDPFGNGNFSNCNGRSLGARTDRGVCMERREVIPSRMSVMSRFCAREARQSAPSLVQFNVF